MFRCPPSKYFRVFFKLLTIGTADADAHITETAYDQGREAPSGGHSQKSPHYAYASTTIIQVGALGGTAGCDGSSAPRDTKTQGANVTVHAFEAIYCSDPDPAKHKKMILVLDNAKYHHNIALPNFP